VSFKSIQCAELASDTGPEIWHVFRADDIQRSDLNNEIFGALTFEPSRAPTETVLESLRRDDAAPDDAGAVLDHVRRQLRLEVQTAGPTGVAYRICA
jgi:hypothetical protein